MLLALFIVNCTLSIAFSAWSVDGDSYAARMRVTVDDTYIDANVTAHKFHVPFIDHVIGAWMADVNDFRFANDANEPLNYAKVRASLNGGVFNSVYDVEMDANATGGTAFWMYVDTASPSDGSSDANTYDTNEFLVWNFEEDSWDGTSGEVIDSSGNGNHGTAAGNATTVAGGYASRGGSFDGEDGTYVSVPLDLGSMDRFSVEMWVSLGDWLASGTKTMFANYGIGYFGAASVSHGALTPSVTQIRFFLRDSDTPGPTTSREVRAVASDLLGWVHVVAVYSSQETVSDANYMELYVNGEATGNLYVDSNAVWTPDLSRTTVRFGDCFDEPLPWPGNIDQVRVYDRVLSPEEIKLRYYNWSEVDHELTYGDIDPGPDPVPASPVMSPFMMSMVAGRALCDMGFVLAALLWAFRSIDNG